MTDAHFFLADLTVAGVVGILMVALLRWACAGVLSPQALYRSWVLVPVLMLASVMPGFDDAPAWVGLFQTSPNLTPVAEAIGAQAIDVELRLDRMDVPPFRAEVAPDGMAIVAGWPLLIVLWASGAAGFLFYAVFRHRTFVGNLGTLSPSSIGEVPLMVASRTGFSPMLLGVFRPMIVVPADFHSRYTAQQREIVLQHEMAHRDRRDPLINLVALLIGTAFWFNPLAYWAVRALKCDQEIACDAVVLSKTKVSRKSYAETLLAVVVDEVSPTVSCAWHSGSRMTHRFDALGRPYLIGQTASMGSIAALLALSGCGFANLQNDLSFSSLPDPAKKMDEVLSLADRPDQTRPEHYRVTNPSAVEINQFGGLLRIVSEDRADALLSVSPNGSSITAQGGVMRLVGDYSATEGECNSLALDRLNWGGQIDTATLRIPHGTPVQIGGYVYTVASDSVRLDLSFSGCGIARIGNVRDRLAIDGRGQHRIAAQNVDGGLVAALRGQTEMSVTGVSGKTDVRLRGQAKLAIRKSGGPIQIEALGQALVRVDQAKASVGVSERQKGQVRIGT